MKEWFARNLSPLANLRWWIQGFNDAIRPPRSYSQSAEDTFLLDRVRATAPESGFYIDVGANHPTKISNTYALYRAGWSGITVEPNRAFRILHRFFRPRDTFVNIGVAHTAGVLEFYYHVWSVLSGFGHESRVGASTSEYLPVLPLDALLSLLPPNRVTILSIDVEGLNFEVLQSGGKLLPLVDYVIVEFGEEEQQIGNYLAEQALDIIHRSEHNLIAWRSKGATRASV